MAALCKKLWSYLRWPGTDSHSKASRITEYRETLTRLYELCQEYCTGLTLRDYETGTKLALTSVDELCTRMAAK